MGNNYYFNNEVICECCHSILKEKTHIGKQSAGRKFVFKKSKDYSSFKEFKTFLKKNNYPIVDEYGTSFSATQMIHIIEESKKGKGFKHSEMSQFYLDDDGFIHWDREFC